MSDVRLSKTGDLPALRSLFGRVFEEDEAGLDLFFSHCYREENALVAEVDGALCGMFYILPAQLLCAGETLDVAYLYALAVEERMRGRGIAGEIMYELGRLLPARGYAAALLKPAEESLYGYYRRFGFDHAFYVKRFPFSAGGPGKVVPIRLDKLPRPRESYFSCRPLFLWNQGMLRFAEDFGRHGGGGTWLIETPQGGGYAHGRIREGKLLVTELGCEAGSEPALLGALASRLGLPGGTALLPPDAPFGEREPTALLKWFIPAQETKDGYFSLAFD
ncbi:MAG: hypothetical protein DBX66_08350 [Clostridiales bacterium]|nr:MAG: hypothetical protein DBX66_08350 [Clostridiales bacterium]